MFDITIFKDLGQRGRRCRIVVYDEGQRGFVRALANTEPGEHVRRITDMLGVLDGNGISPSSEVYSASFLDSFDRGYDRHKSEIVDAYGPVHIEAHAYSSSPKPALAKFEAQIADNVRDPRRGSLVLCATGHDDYRVRFPATSNGVLAIGLLRSDGTILGAGNAQTLPPAFVVPDIPFPCLDSDGSPTTSSGTSAAVAFAAGVSALLYEHIYAHDGAPAFAPGGLHAALLLLGTPYAATYILNRFDVLKQTISSVSLPEQKGRSRRMTMRLRRYDSKACRLVVIARPMSATISGLSHEHAISIAADLHGEIRTFGGPRALLEFDQLPDGKEVTLGISVDGLHDGLFIAWTGADVEVSSDRVTAPKRPDETAILGVSASHDASAVLVLGGKIFCGIQLERLTRIKHDGGPVLDRDDTIQYCLSAAGLSANEVDTYAFNIQALAPGYIGLSRPITTPTFKSFDPFGSKSLFVSHHLCHAFAAYSGCRFKSASVVVADGSGGVTVGARDLILDGPSFRAYVHRERSTEEMGLHTFSVYDFSRTKYTLRYREVAPSFNVRCGSSSLGETYAAVSQFVFESWQASGKLMGLSPYGQAEKRPTLLQRDENGSLNFSSSWKVELSSPAPNVLQNADLAARVQKDLEVALIDRFEKHIGVNCNIVFTGGIALNSVVNRKIREQVPNTGLYFLPAQHDAGVSIGAAAAAIYRDTKSIPDDMFESDFLGFRYSARDIALAINQFAGRLNVSRIDAPSLADRLSKGGVFGYFSLTKGSEFGPRALGARSILADPRNKETWKFVNKWVKYREEFRPFAPMVTEDDLSRYFDADGKLPYMLEVVPVREKYRAQLSAITHVDGSARVQTISAQENPEIYRLLKDFEAITGYPILLNTSFNVRGQAMVEQPSQALEMLLSTQLSGVVFGDLLVEVHDVGFEPDLCEHFQLSPGTALTVTCDGQGVSGRLAVKNQGKVVTLGRDVCTVLEALQNGLSLGSSLALIDTGNRPQVQTQIGRFMRLRYINAHMS